MATTEGDADVMAKRIEVGDCFYSSRFPFLFLLVLFTTSSTAKQASTDCVCFVVGFVKQLNIINSKASQSRQKQTVCFACFLLVLLLYYSTLLVFAANFRLLLTSFPSRGGAQWEVSSIHSFPFEKLLLGRSLRWWLVSRVHVI